MIDEKIMRPEERAVFSLRSLYGKYGYLPYKMSKFEEYELYIRNKDFLVSDRVISFNDTNGRLMALKPDVTLSIIKNGEDTPGVKQKVFYNENVYRVSESTRRFKEIMQTGLECIGDVGIYDICEVINLAAQSLALISGDFYIEMSHLGILSSVIESVCSDPVFSQKAMECISQKNTHDLKNICREYSVSEENYRKIASLAEIYGDRNKVIGSLRAMGGADGLEELEALSALLDFSPFSDRIRFDFSTVNDINYYNGFVFRGFINGICTSVLTGGQYDRMMKKMNRTSGAVGFALYLDRLEDMNRESSGYDVDYLLLYDDETPLRDIVTAVDGLVSKGYTVSAQKCAPEKLRYRNMKNLGKKGSEC